MSVRALDLTERGVVLAFYVLSTTALASSVVFRRRPQHVSRRPSDWLLAVVGTVAPLANGVPDGPHPLPQAVGAVITLLGVVVSLLAKLTLRRNFSIVPARTGVVVRGPYRLVRHPMYSGYALSHLGVLLYGFTARNLVAYAVCWAFLWIRMDREEAVLADAESYRAYRARVPYRVVWGLL